MQGFFLTPHVGAYYAHFEGDSLVGSLAKRNLAFPDLIPREEEEQYLREWDTDKDSFGESHNANSERVPLEAIESKKVLCSPIGSEIFRIERSKSA